MTWLGHGQDEERGRNSVRAKLMQELPGSTPDQAESRSRVTSAVNFRNKTGDTSAVGNYKVKLLCLPGIMKTLKYSTHVLSKKVQKSMYPSLRNAY